MPKCPNCGHAFTEGSIPQPDPVKVFPHKITFENDSDQGNGAAAILFRALTDGAVSSVIVNGELARKGVPYKGCPVFLMSKPGPAYSRPLRMIITTADGQTYTATGSSGETPSVPTGQYKNFATYTSYGVRNGRQAWRIPKKGPEFGPGPIKLVFSSGKEFVVKNTSKNCRDDQNTCARNSKAIMYGTVFKPGIGPNVDGDADTGTSHGGVYLQAPWNDTSKSVKVYW